MDITVTGRQVTVTPAMKDYTLEKVGSAMKIMDISPLTAEVVLQTERNPSNADPCICEITLRTKGHVMRVEESEADMYAAIDVAAAKILRQMRKYKTKVLDRKQRREGSGEAFSAGELDFDKLMEELSGDSDEIVRVKTVDFTPQTQEEALIEIDLLGHDFYGYIDRDTEAFCILYRRTGGGYGLLAQKLPEA